MYAQLVVLLDEASRLGVEERVGGRRAQRAAGGHEAADVVVGGLAIARGARLVGRGPVDGSSGRHRGYVNRGYRASSKCV
jgi:hypothetical protein